VNSSFAQDNMTTATNETGAMMGGNQTNQTGGNQTQQGPLLLTRIGNDLNLGKYTATI
jgi:hypothetical protein